MTATVEPKINSMGEKKFNIVPPVTFREFPRNPLLSPAMEGHVGYHFDTADQAFEAAFRDCRRDIDRIIESGKGPAEA